jgi:hypothetical protein
MRISLFKANKEQSKRIIGKYSRIQSRGLLGSRHQQALNSMIEFL